MAIKSIKKKQIAGGVVIFLIFFFSYGVSPYGPYIPVFGSFFVKLQAGFAFLSGSPQYVQGHLWRLNQTNYIIWAKSYTINFESNVSIADFNQCYSAVLTIQNSPNYILSLNMSKIPVYTFAGCKE